MNLRLIVGHRQWADFDSFASDHQIYAGQSLGIWTMEVGGKVSKNKQDDELLENWVNCILNSTAPEKRSKNNVQRRFLE